MIQNQYEFDEQVNGTTLIKHLISLCPYFGTTKPASNNANLRHILHHHPLVKFGGKNFVSIRGNKTN